MRPLPRPVWLLLPALALAGVLGAPWLAPVPLTAEERPVEVLPDLVYASPGGKDLRLDLARPRGAAGVRPAVVVIHGGGWAAGSRKAHSDLIRLLAQRGYVAATVQYRFAPLHPWPAQIEDVKAAVRWLRRHADEHGIDPAQVGAIGFSAGAHLAMMLGATDPRDGLEGPAEAGAPSSKVQAVVSWFGPTDLGSSDYPEAARRLIQALLGPRSSDAQGGASPVHYLDRGDAPMLLLHGTKDRVVPVSQATRMSEALTRAGVAGEVRLLLGADHGWDGPLLAETVEDSIRWFERHLKGVRPTLPALR